MKRLLFVLSFVILFAACSNEEEKISDPNMNNESEVGGELAQNESTEQPKDESTEALLKAIKNLRSWPHMKTQYTDSFMEHPELDPFEKSIELTYAPDEPFVHKKYSDNYFGARYESYVNNENYFYVNNEYGQNQWEYVEEDFVLDIDVSNTIANMLKIIVDEAESFEMKNEGNNKKVAYVNMKNGDFEQVAIYYQTMTQMLVEIAANNEVMEYLEGNSEIPLYKFTDIKAEIFVNEALEIYKYKLTVEYDNDEESSCIIEQSFIKINPEKDFVVPGEITAG